MTPLNRAQVPISIFIVTVYLVPFPTYSASKWRDLENWVLRVVHGRWKWRYMSSYWRSIVTMALCCVISEIKRDIGRKLRFFIPLHSTHPLWGPRRNIAITFGMKKLEWCAYSAVNWACVQTCRHNTGVWQTDVDSVLKFEVCAMHSITR